MMFKLLQRTRINHQIKAAQVRVITEDGGNLGLLTLSEALKKAESTGLDLIEISPNAVPPVAKIMDFGRWQYLENKKQKAARAHAHTSETKGLQVHIGTSEHDLGLKAAQASKFLGEGHRVKIDLFLRGRAKYLDKNFLKERLERILKLISVDYKVSAGPEKSMKGLTVVIERVK